MGHAATVLDPGPIPYFDIALYGDPDLEHGLEHLGFDPKATRYRLLEIRLEDISEVATMSTWRTPGRAYIDAIREGKEFPPIVVTRNQRGWGLIDGVNRSHAFWELGIRTIRAYELMTEQN